MADQVFHVLCHGIGPALATVLTNPLEVVKTRIQFSGEKSSRGNVRIFYSSPFQCFSDTWQAEGVRGIQAGLAPAITREFSKTLFRYGLFSPLVDHLRIFQGITEDQKTPIYVKILAGGSSGAIAALICNPLDLVKIQLQASGRSGARRYAYDTGTGALQHIVHEGGIAALWKGVRVSILRSMVSTSTMMTVLSTAKDSGVPTSVASLLAAFCTIYAQAPLDVVRTRLYCGANNCGATVSPVKIAREIVQSEGVWAFWKGANVNFFRYAPHAVLSFYLSRRYKTL